MRTQKTRTYIALTGVILLLVACSTADTTTIVDEPTTEPEQQTQENQTTEENNNTTENQTLIGEPTPETTITNEVSENFIEYTFRHSDKDSIKATLNGEVIYDSKTQEERSGVLKGYPKKGNMLTIEFTDYPDNITTAFEMLLNGEEEILAWRRHNASGTFEAPLDFTIEETDEQT